MAFYAGALASLTGQAQGKKDAYADAAREAAVASDAAEKRRQFDAQLGLQQQQLAQTGAVNQSNIDHQKRQDRLDDIANGVGLNPWAPPLNHGVSLTTTQRADQAREEAHYWRSHGATVKADEADKSVKELDTVAKSQTAAAAKTQEDANHLIEIMARAQNWSAQQKIAMQRIAMGEKMQILKGSQQEQQVRERLANAAKLQVDRDQAALARTTMTVQARAQAQARIDQTRQAIAQMTTGSANWRSMMGQGLEQTDASGNPVMPSVGGATINVYGGAQPQIEPPAFDGQQSGSGATAGRPIQPPAVRQPIQPPAIRGAQGQPPTATSPQPPSIVDLSRATRRAVTADGAPVGLIDGQWRDARGTVYGPDGKPIKR